MTELDTGTDDLLARVDDGVAVLTMNRPERRNALSGAMLTAMGRILAQVEVDDDVGCVVLTGAGGAFCAGGDVKGMAERGKPADARAADAGAGSAKAGSSKAGRADNSRVSVDAAIHHQRLDQRATSGKLWSMPKPTIAAVPGPAAGAGFSLALACDLRYAADTAFFTTAFAKVAFAGDYGGTWFLTRLVGSAKAKELYYFSERLSAQEAQALGVVNAVFPAAELDEQVMARARRLAEGPTVAYRYMKENLDRAVNGSLEECLDLEVTHHIHTGFTEDHRAAVQAFVEKREPHFRGR
jgi:2-(1,2-epoxy-1,2-dihydrophenyl)acetyl-CoA isomerase